MSKEIRNKIANILNEEFGESQKDKLVGMLNALEFKNDVLAAGGEIYAVGGIVRDAIMGTPSDDLDIVVRGVAYDQLFAILSKYGKPTDTSHVDENGKKDFGSTKFVSSNKAFNQFLADNGAARDIDVMLPRKDAKDVGVKGHKGIKSEVNPMFTIQDDLERRDITINAIAMDMAGNLIVNGTGVEDIQNGVIKAVNADAFIEDPLRMLRAVRFAARYNYNWDPETVRLIKENASLLADKEELHSSRFLKEFQKMIGKADLSRAVRLIVELGMYKHIFGVESKIQDYTKFQYANSVGEMAYMMFDNEASGTILGLVNNNITDDKYTAAVVESLINYVGNVKNKNLDFIKRVNELASIFLKKMDTVARTGPGVDVLTNSYYIEPHDREIARKFSTGELPAGENDVAFKGQEFAEFVRDIIVSNQGEFSKSKDGRKFGNAKRLALTALYNEEIENDVDSIKRFLIDSANQWML